MELRAGYKQTEVGVIPEDWVLEKVGNLATKVASGRSHVDSKLGEYPVHGSTGIIGFSVHNEYSGRAILVARVGANAGKLCIVEGEYGVTDNTIMVKTACSVNMDYFWRQLEAKRLNSMVFGSGQPLITGTQIKGLFIPLPPTKAEQEAIAGALSDADGLIESLEQLIAKKRHLKQGAMQQLLTGKKRLPGFQIKTSFKQTEVGVIPEDWGVVRLGEVSQITTGRKDVNEGNPNGAYPFFTCSRTHTFSDFYSFDMEAILIAGNGDVGNLSYCHGKFEAYQRTYVVHGISTHVGYLWQQLQDRLATSLGLGKIGSSIPYIKKENLTGFSFGSPPKAEQTAIATVLSDMDAEIEALETKLGKARQLKAGMMHNLLTGRIRLI